MITSLKRRRDKLMFPNGNKLLLLLVLVYLSLLPLHYNGHHHQLSSSSIIISHQPAFFTTCICIDRKIFYQIITLLIDPSLVPDGVKITESNYKEYLPDEHLDLVRRLKL